MTLMCLQSDKRKAEDALVTSSPIRSANGTYSAKDRTIALPARSFSFGPFTLLSEQQRLLRANSPVHLGSRALAILSVLVEHAGELVSKHDLLSRVWPDTFVDESNLKVNVSALRKALDEDNSHFSHILTVNGRGYRFVTPVTVCESKSSLESRRRASNLPLLSRQIIGRSEAIERVIAQLLQCRFVTIVGSAGLGKSTVATAVAEKLLESYKDGVHFVDLSTLSDPHSVPHAISVALGLLVTMENAIEQLSSQLQNREILLFVDTCEHVLCSTAECLEVIQSRCPKVHILATSREPLGAKGERLYRLPPLAVPPANPELTADIIRSFPAVELFLTRATETLGDFRVDDGEALMIGELCRQLDGVPLALELAATRVRLLGFEGLPSVTNEYFLQFSQGQRTSPRRHESLATAYEWSFDLLPENERSAFLRLSSLNDSFGLETAVSVASGGSMGAAETTACIANLVSKSLIERMDHGASRFRLLTLVRYFASKKRLSCGGCEENQSEQRRFNAAVDGLLSRQVNTSTSRVASAERSAAINARSRIAASLTSW